MQGVTTWSKQTRHKEGEGGGGAQGRERLDTRRGRVVGHRAGRG